MKRLLVCVLMVLLAQKTHAADTFPDTITLTNGAKLYKTVPQRWLKDRVVIKHRGGVDPIQFRHIASLSVSQLEAIRDTPSNRLKAPATARVSGQIYVKTHDADTHVFASRVVYIFPAASEQQLRTFAQSKLPANYSQMTHKLQNAAFTTAWNFAIASEPAFAQAITDDQGRYSLVLPPGDYLLLCIATRKIGGSRGVYNWVVRFTAPAHDVDLNNLNTEPLPQ